MKRMMISLLLIGVLSWVVGYGWYLWRIHHFEEDSHTHCDALVVLTGSAGRIERGFELLEVGRAEKLMITGVGDDRVSESFLDQYQPSPLLKTKLETPGVFSIDRIATSTFGNAEQTKLWVEQQSEPIRSICLITAHYHMPRSLLVFKRKMPEIQLTADASEGWDVQLAKAFSDPVTFRVLLREYHKYLVVRAITLLEALRGA